MDNARDVIGHFAEDARWFMKKSRGWAMYPITQGKEVNIVAFVQDGNDWVGDRSAREVSREEMLKDFEEFDRRLFKLLDVGSSVQILKLCMLTDFSTSTQRNGLSSIIRIPQHTMMGGFAFWAM
jgi:hypothetical protein